MDIVKRFVQWLYKLTNQYINIRDDCYIARQALTRKLKRQFPGAYIFITDSQPTLIYKQDMEKLLFLNLSRGRDWVESGFDCENFARVLLGQMSFYYGGHAFGIVGMTTLRGNHMLNCFIDEFGKFYFIEPQTNDIFRPDKNKHKPFMVII